MIALFASTAAAREAPLSLGECIRIAKARSPVVAAAQYGVHAIEERERELWWNTWFPILKVRSLATIIPPQGDDDPIDGVDLSDTNFWSKTTVEAYLPLYTFGKVSAAWDMVEHGLDAANAVLSEARGMLAMRTSQAWYGVQLAEGLAGLVKDADGGLRDAREKLERMEEEDDDEYDEGDTFRLRIYEAKVQQLVLDNARLGRLARAGLRAAMGLAANTALNLPEPNPLEPVQVTLKSLDEIVKLGVRERPEIVAQRHRVEIARAQADLRWAEFFPDLFLAGSFVAAGSTVEKRPGENVFEGAVFNSIGGGAAVGLQLTLDYPQKVARYRRAQAELRAAEAQAKARTELLKLRVQEVWEDARMQQEMLGFRQRAMDAAKSLRTMTAHEYENSIDDPPPFEDVLRAAAGYLQQRSEWLKAVHAFNLSVARLSQAVGADVTRER